MKESLVRVGAFATLSVALAWGVWDRADRPMPGNPIDAASNSISLEGTRECYGDILGEAKVYVTSPLEGSSYTAVPLRSDRNPDVENIVGWAKFDEEVVAQPEMGVGYAGGSTSSNGLGDIECESDKDHQYGAWYKIRRVDALVLENGEWVEKVLFNVYTAGNFLTELNPDPEPEPENIGILS